MLLAGYDDDRAAKIINDAFQMDLARSKPITDLQKRVGLLEQKLAELESRLKS